MDKSKIVALILAAGQGKRMNSTLPKVLIPVLGKPMLRWVMETCQAAGLSNLVLVVGHRQETVREEVGADASFVEQLEQKGTGHAVQMAVAAIQDFEWTLVLNGDCPLLTPAALQALFEQAPSHDLVFLSVQPSRPVAYGRVLRQNGKVTAVVEAKDASPEQLAVKEMNGGMYLFRTQPLLAQLAHLTADNSQGEYYITDLVSLFLKEGLRVEAVCVDEREVLGANTVDEVQLLEGLLRERAATQ